MNLVDEQDGLLLIKSAAFPSLLYYPAQVSDAGTDGAYGTEVRIGDTGDNEGEGSLTAARGTPQNH